MALAGTSNAAEDEVAILFELGLLAEEEQDWENALQAYAAAAKIDPGYRDLAQRLESLRARQGQ
jgi:hypothetical protein